MMLAMMVGNSQLLNGDGEEKLGTSINDVKCNDEEVLEAVINFLKLKEDAESPIAREEARKRTAQQKRADFHHSARTYAPQFAYLDLFEISCHGYESTCSPSPAFSL